MDILILIVIFIVLLLVAFGLLKIVVYKMADSTIFVFTIKEGEAVAVMIGEELYDIYMKLKGSYLDVEYNVVPEKDEDDPGARPKLKRKKPKSALDAIIPRIFPGVYWLGLPGVKKIYQYSFAWTKVDEGTGESKSRSELIKQIYVKTYQYLFLLEDAETSSMIPITIELLVQIRVVNPYKALFKNDHWLKIVNGEVLDRARTFISTFGDPEEIMELSQGDRIKNEDLKARLPRKDGKIMTSIGEILFDILKKEEIIKQLERRVGARILRIDVGGIYLGEFAKHSQARIIAQKEGEASFEKAKWERMVTIEIEKGRITSFLMKTESELAAYRALQISLGSDFVIALKLVEVYANTAKAGTNFVLDGGTLNSMLGTLGKTKTSGDVEEIERKLFEIAEQKGLDPVKVMNKIKQIAEKSQILDEKQIAPGKK